MATDIAQTTTDIRQSTTADSMRLAHRSANISSQRETEKDAKALSRVRTGASASQPEEEGAGDSDCQGEEDSLDAARVGDSPGEVERSDAPTSSDATAGGERLRDHRIRRLTASAPAGQLHMFLKSLQATGNEVQLAFMEALQALHESKGFIEIGCSSFRQYCQEELGLGRSTAYEYLRCARALAELPVTATMFRDGDLSWDRVKAISRVATPATEVTWIQVALESSVRELQVEVRSAQEDGRDKPRDDRYGLPNLMTRLVLDLTLEDKERLLVALARAAGSLGVSEDYVLGTRSITPEGSGRNRDDRMRASEGPALELEGDAASTDEEDFRLPDPRTALIGLVDAILAGRFKVSGTREPGHADPAVFVAYNGCPDCNRAKAHTRYGSLEIPQELLAKRAQEAQTLVIPEEAEFEDRELAPGERDKPNSALLAKRVLFRDGLQCATPGCTNRRGLQAHHMQHRADGGPTVMKNLSSQCPVCHSLEHSELLEVTGNATTGELTWKRKPRASDVERRETDVLVAKAARPAAAVGRATRSELEVADVDIDGKRDVGIDADGESETEGLGEPETDGEAGAQACPYVGHFRTDRDAEAVRGIQPDNVLTPDTS